MNKFIDEHKEWFEANYLDGDKIQEGQMLSSQECFDAIAQLFTNLGVELVKDIETMKGVYSAKDAIEKSITIIKSLTGVE